MRRIDKGTKVVAEEMRAWNVGFDLFLQLAESKKDSLIDLARSQAERNTMCVIASLRTSSPMRPDGMCVEQQRAPRRRHRESPRRRLRSHGDTHTTEQLNKLSGRPFRPYFSLCVSSLT